MEKILASKGNDGKYWYSMPCIVCDENVRLTDDEYKMVQSGYKLRSKVCPNCKQAILHMRKCIENGKADVNTHDSCDN